MEREYEIEKRKNREQLEYLKEKDKEYSKLKVSGRYPLAIAYFTLYRINLINSSAEHF